MEKYQVNDEFTLTDDLRIIFEKARNGGWKEEDLMDAIYSALGEAGYESEDE